MYLKAGSIGSVLARRHGRRHQERSLEAPDLRDHLAPRRRQDDADREAAALRRGDPPGRLREGPRRGRQTTSDWMEIERQRGISISTSVLQFDYAGRRMNLLDTPGHNDFSEDTYRTLAAADSAVMLIDSVKGVEPQTIKLFQVCRMRGIPIVTFINKMDRHGRPPLELLDEIEKVLGIPCAPVNWPIGSGPGFHGVYDRERREVLRFERADGGERMAPAWTCGLDDPGAARRPGRAPARGAAARGRPPRHGGHPVRPRGVPGRQALARLLRQRDDQLRGRAVPRSVRRPRARRPVPARARRDRSTPDSDRFSGFVFKIQANMDPNHRDRVAFVRVCSGRFTRGMEVNHVRTGPSLHHEPHDAVPGAGADHDRRGVRGRHPRPVGRRQPAHRRHLGRGGLVRVRGDAALLARALRPGAPEGPAEAQAAQEGARAAVRRGRGPALLRPPAARARPDPGRRRRAAVRGDRASARGGVQGRQSTSGPLPYKYARWIEGEPFAPEQIERGRGANCVLDAESRPIVLFESDWALRKAIEDHPHLRFLAAVQPARSGTRQ